jgi:hypothetical protein
MPISIMELIKKHNGKINGDNPITFATPEDKEAFGKELLEHRYLFEMPPTRVVPQVPPDVSDINPDLVRLGLLN